MRRYSILIADDHAIVVEGLRRLLEREGFEVLDAVNNGQALLQAVAELQPDLIIADISMPLLNGIEAVRAIHRQNPKAKVIFLTMHSEIAYAIAALSAGALGYVLKSAANEDLITAIHAALKGRIHLSKAIAKSVAYAQETPLTKGRDVADMLTHRQREVLRLLAEGKQVKEIAALLELSIKTIEFHKYQIMNLLGLRTVAELARYAARRGLVE